ncbi:unnamed protein product [Effrenium voratum]|nr:unnamed protein product [Effrenium voratum]
MVCIVSTEHSVTYERMFQDLDHLMHRLCGVPQFSALVGQVHGDFHSGLQIARENHFRRAVFAGDFSHCIGATRVKRKEQGLMPETEYPWRGGIFTTVKKVLRDASRLQLVEQVVHMSRVLPWPLFHAAWDQLYRALISVGEMEAVRKIKTYYVHEVASQYRAHWAAASLQPGSYCGSQPQESYHRHRLRAGITSLWQPMQSLLEELDLFMKTRATEARQDTCSPMVDVPCGAWSPTFRAEAAVYIDGGHYLAEKKDENIFLAMRRDVHSIPYAKTPLTPDVLSQLQRLLLVDPESMACAASLCGLGASAEGTPEGMTATVATLQRWVLTIVGPVAETVWAWQPTERVASHSSARCLLCKTFAIYGSCSHCYVAFRVSGLLCEESKLAEVAPKQRLRSKGALLTPTKAPLKPDLGSEAAREPDKRASDGVSLDLRRLLLLHGLHGFTDLVAQYELTREELVHWDVSALVSLLRSPAGPTRRFLQDIKEGVNSKAATGSACGAPVPAATLALEAVAESAHAAAVPAPTLALEAVPGSAPAAAVKTPTPAAEDQKKRSYARLADAGLLRTPRNF